MDYNLLRKVIKYIFKYTFIRPNKTYRKAALHDLYELINNTDYIPSTVLNNNYLSFAINSCNGYKATLYVPVGMKYKNINDTIIYLAPYNEKYFSDSAYIKINLYKCYYMSEFINSNNSYSNDFNNFIKDLNLKHHTNIRDNVSVLLLDAIFEPIMLANYIGIDDMDKVFEIKEKIQLRVNTFNSMIREE